MIACITGGQGERWQTAISLSSQDFGPFAFAGIWEFAPRAVAPNACYHDAERA